MTVQTQPGKSQLYTKNMMRNQDCLLFHQGDMENIHQTLDRYKSRISKVWD